MINIVRKRDFIYYFVKTLINTTVQSLRIIFVLFLWFLVFILNTLLISPFLPSTFMNWIFGELVVSESNLNIMMNGNTLFISIIFGGFAQIVLFLALCVFEFHHRHRNGVVADFGLNVENMQGAPPPNDGNMDNMEEEKEEENNAFNVMPPEQDRGFLNVCYCNL